MISIYLQFFIHPVVDAEMKRKWHGREFIKTEWKRWQLLFSIWCLFDLVFSPILLAVFSYLENRRKRKEREENKRKKNKGRGSMNACDISTYSKRIYCIHFPCSNTSSTRLSLKVQKRNERSGTVQ